MRESDKVIDILANSDVDKDANCRVPLSVAAKWITFLKSTEKTVPKNGIKSTETHRNINVLTLSRIYFLNLPAML